MVRRGVPWEATDTAWLEPDNATDMVPDAVPPIRSAALLSVALPETLPDAPWLRSSQLPET
jgi:hypothetical protein